MLNAKDNTMAIHKKSHFFYMRTQKTEKPRSFICAADLSADRSRGSGLPPTVPVLLSRDAEGGDHLAVFTSTTCSPCPRPASPALLLAPLSPRHGLFLPPCHSTPFGAGGTWICGVIGVYWNLWVLVVLCREE